jgi:hypothetical protein
MDDLIGRRVANAGVSRGAATQISGITPQGPLEQKPFYRRSPGISSIETAELATSGSHDHECPNAHGCSAEQKADASVQQSYLEFHT